MNKVMRNEKVIAMIITIMAVLASVAIPMASVEAKGPEMISVWPSMPPVIDGAASAQEWGGAASINLTSGPWTYGYMLVQNDASNLYLLIDLTLDIVENDPYKGVTSADYFELSFDVDLDIGIGPYIDVMYFPIPDKLVKTYYTGPFEEWIGGELSHSQLGVGFGSSLNSQTDHRIWELAISLPEIDAVPGGLVRLGLRTHSDDPPFQYDQPENLHGDFSSHTEITLANRQVELLILAHKDFCAALEPLKDHKEYTGMNTYIQSWQSLDNSFCYGVDEPERIKKGIYAYEMKCDTEYVMLVGDIDKFPARYTWWGRPDDEGWHVSDLYYADIREHGKTNFENWDLTGNRLYGEIEWDDDGTINNDHIDFLPEVAVGRIPASTVSEVDAYVSKVITYELNTLPSEPWFKTAGLYTGNRPSDCNPCSNDISGYLTNQGFDVEERYWDFALNQPYSGVPGVIISDMNSGMGFVNYCGHGNPNEWYCLGLGPGDLGGLTNSDKLPIVFANTCMTGEFFPVPPYHPYEDVNGADHCGTENGEVFSAPVDLYKPAPLQDGETDCNGLTYEFDRPCLAETFIFGNDYAPSGTGAIAYLGGRSPMQNLANDLNDYFFQAYDWENYRVLGDMWVYMIEKYYEEHGLADSDNWKADGSDWWTGCIFDEPRNLILFGDPSLRVGGVGNVHKPDFEGTYGMVHDGWEGTLELITSSDDPTSGHINVGGNYTSAGGQKHYAGGYVSTWDYPMGEDWGPNHKIEFYVDFKDTPTYWADNQAFEGYVFTQTKDAMAGITWSQDTPDTPFGFYALKGGGVSTGASTSGPVTVQDFVGSYYMNHDGWEGTLVLEVDTSVVVPGDQNPNLRGQYTSADGDWEGNVRGYAHEFLPEDGPDHKIEFYIDSAGTSLKFEGYLFTETKDAMAGMFWVNDTPFGFYALNQASTPNGPGNNNGGCGMPTAADTMPLALVSVTLAGLWARRWWRGL
jgi:hypothetical protein